MVYQKTINQAKECNLCKKTKPVAEFGLAKGGALGVRGMCKPCYNMSNKDWNRKRLYGIDSDNYTSLLKSQNKACGICKCTPNSREDLCVDHCHDTGVIRGLLCKKCNRGIGKLGDNLQAIQKVIRYFTISSKIRDGRSILMETYHRPDNRQVEGKSCTKCKMYKSIDKYHKSKIGTKGLKPRCKVCAKFDETKRLYNLDDKQFLSFLVSQNDSCGACESKFSVLQEVFVDHDHVSGKVRGLLCKECNWGIGVLGDSKDGIVQAEKYLMQQHIKG
jgi:hypothetical protein